MKLSMAGEDAEPSSSRAPKATLKHRFPWGIVMFLRQVIIMAEPTVVPTADIV